jgi:hypothetical protein
MMTDREIDLFVQAFLLPPPCGFTKQEKKEILNWLKEPSPFVELAERRQSMHD